VTHIGVYHDLSTNALSTTRVVNSLSVSTCLTVNY